MMVNDVAYGYYFILLRLLFASSNTTVILFASAFSATTVNGGGGAHHSLFNSEAVTMSNDQQTQEEEQQTPHRRRYYSPFFPLNNDNNSQQSSAAALVILNTPIPTIAKSGNNNNSNSQQTLPDVFRILWESTSFHVCADGGANRLYDATINTTNNALIPDLITGDLDSLRPDVQSYYEQQGVPIVCVQDQNYHDLDKSLMAVEKWIVEQQQQKMTTSDHYSTNGNGSSCKQQEESTDTTTTSCFIYGGFGGRFDQEMACINTLYSWGQNKETFQHTQMSIYDEETGVILLPEEPIVNEILIRFPDVQDEKEEDNLERSRSDQNEVVGGGGVGEGPTCGLIPIGGRCERVYTSGLKWNLNGDMPLEFGGLVSSSNRIVERVVTVTTSSPLLFSFEIVKR